MRNFAVIVTVLLVACVPSSAQFQAETYALTAAERQELEQGRDSLRQAVTALKKESEKSGKPAAALLPDVEIFLDAVDRNLSQNLFFSKQNVTQARACLKEGETRASELREGKATWKRQTDFVCKLVRGR